MRNVNFCCFHFRAVTNQLNRPASCRNGLNCRSLHANAEHVQALASMYHITCERVARFGSCYHADRGEHP